MWLKQRACRSERRSPSDSCCLPYVLSGLVVCWKSCRQSHYKKYSVDYVIVWVFEHLWVIGQGWGNGWRVSQVWGEMYILRHRLSEVEMEP